MIVTKTGGSGGAGIKLDHCMNSELLTPVSETSGARQSAISTLRGIVQRVTIHSRDASQSSAGTRRRTNLLTIGRAMELIVAVPLTVLSIYGQQAPPPQQLVFQPYHASGMYELGETVGWLVLPGPAAPTYAYKWTIRRNNSVILKEGKLDVSSGMSKI